MGKQTQRPKRNVPNAYGYGKDHSLTINDSIWRRLKNAGNFIFGNWGKLVAGPKQSGFPKHKLTKEGSLSIAHLRDTWRTIGIFLDQNLIENRQGIFGIFSFLAQLLSTSGVSTYVV